MRSGTFFLSRYFLESNHRQNFMPIEQVRNDLYILPIMILIRSHDHFPAPHFQNSFVRMEFKIRF